MQNEMTFHHDCTAINNPKMMNLLSICGLRGVAMYWVLVEFLHQQESSSISYDSYKQYIRFYCHFEKEGSSICEDIEKALLETELLKEKDGRIYSERVLKNKEKNKQSSLNAF